MLLRFDREFHDRYIHGTFRHQPLSRVKYQQAEQLIRQHTTTHSNSRVVNSSKVSSSQDAYYQVYYREDDTNVGCACGLGDQRVILLPWELRQSTKETEFQLYQ